MPDLLLPSALLRAPTLSDQTPDFRLRPLLQSFDRRLSGWSAALLSSGGRLTLCNAVLNNLDTYYMFSYLLPRGVIEIIDNRRRAFF
jgi:hypothetical protein